MHVFDICKIKPDEYGAHQICKDGMRLYGNIGLKVYFCQ